MSLIPPESVGGSLDVALDAAAGLLAGRRIAVLTGAGVSTDSGIPDYRGEGAPVHRTPMNFAAFLADENNRRRYWAGSHLGWTRFSSVSPNAGHYALAQMEDAETVSGIITQNVDGLHGRAGSRQVTELHGVMHRVVCLTCGQKFSRDAVAERLTRDNPWLTRAGALEMRPDGDVHIEDVERMRVPDCTVCGGLLKPDVVFFGEFVPTTVFAAARALVHASDALIIAGSSLAVNSGVRLLDQAARRQLPIVIINRGPTRGDKRATLRIDAGTSEVLPALAERLG